MKQEKYFIFVSEPWDFESKDGRNIIKGNIISIKNNQCLVFMSDHYLKFGNVGGNILILTPRHYGIDFSNLQDERLVINGSLLLKEYNDDLDVNELQKNAIFELIGNIKKKQNLD